jgi:hypothetical protein
VLPGQTAFSPAVFFTAYSVTFNFLYLGVALTLLWFPRHWLRVGSLGRGRGRRKPQAWTPNREREPGDISVRFGEEFSKARNWIDFFRAFAGGAAIGGLFSGVVAFAAADPKPTKETIQLLFILKLLVFLASLLIQMVRLEGRLTLFAPLFYMQGLAFGLLVNLPSALLAMIGVWALNPVLPSAAIFLVVFAFLELSLGFMFKVPPPDTLLAAGLSLLPVLISILCKRHLAQFTKRTKIISASPTPD